MSTSKSFEAYIEELRRFQAAAKPISEPVLQPPTVTEETPLPIPPSPEPVEPVYIPANEFRREQWQPTKQESGTGFLQIQASTGRGALPIAGAKVVVSRPDEFGNPNRLVVFTDTDGMTPFLSLPTVDGSLSQSPENPRPFSVYNIRTEAPKQLTVVNLQVPIFDGISSVQRVEMLGPQEDYDGDGVVVFDESPHNRIDEQ